MSHSTVLVQPFGHGISHQRPTPLGVGEGQPVVGLRMDHMPDAWPGSGQPLGSPEDRHGVRDPDCEGDGDARVTEDAEGSGPAGVADESVERAGVGVPGVPDPQAGNWDWEVRAVGNGHPGRDGAVAAHGGADGARHRPVAAKEGLHLSHARDVLVSLGPVEVQGCAKGHDGANPVGVLGRPAQFGAKVPGARVHSDASVGGMERRPDVRVAQK